MRINARIVVTAGTPINISTALATHGQFAWADRILITPAKGGTGVIYVLDLSAIKDGTTADKSQGTQVCAQLAAATASAPGSIYSDTASPKQGNGIDLTKMYIDGDVNADPVIVSADLID